MSEIRTYTYRIAPREVDFTCRATIMTLGDHILHTAGEDADRNGFGVRELNGYNASWVLSRMAIEVQRMPDEYEEIVISTWVSEIGRLMTTRNFEVFDKAGVRIAAAVTYWVMIDLTTRRPLDLHALSECKAAVQEKPSPIEPPVKLPSPECRETTPHKVVYSDIDFNCHANSMKYLQWVIDTMPIEKLTDREFDRVEINFIHESRYGEVLTIVSDCAESPLFEIDDAEGRAICRIALHLSPGRHGIRIAGE